jgi:hypothetical protein
MPFSNNTSRQRWENGQVVPEYRTIMFTFPQKAEGPARGKTVQQVFPGAGPTPCDGVII